MTQDKIEPSPEARDARIESARQRLQAEEEIAGVREALGRLNSHLEVNHIAQKVRQALSGVTR